MVLSAACMLFGAVCFLYYLTLAVYAGPEQMNRMGATAPLADQISRMIGSIIGRRLILFQK